MRLFSDNLGVVYAIRNNFSGSPAVRERIRKLHERLLECDCSLVAHYIPGPKNTVADRLSRIDVGDRYKFNPDVFQYIENMSSLAFTIDRFATALNT